ncbi:MAG: hypothetical protein M1831_004405 [Alyxoria varia]|nr:MAG: hypothetical protein M1831_004405 [Alyxoria varia]
MSQRQQVEDYVQIGDVDGNSCADFDPPSGYEASEALPTPPPPPRRRRRRRQDRRFNPLGRPPHRRGPNNLLPPPQQQQQHQHHQRQRRGPAVGPGHPPAQPSHPEGPGPYTVSSRLQRVLLQIQQLLDDLERVRREEAWLQEEIERSWALVRGTVEEERRAQGEQHGGGRGG